MPNVIETTDAADNAGTTYTLRVGETAQGRISTLGDHDQFRVDLVAGQTYTFAMVGTGGFAAGQLNDTYLTLFDANGEYVAEDDDAGPGANSTFTFTATTSGAYYLDAAAYGDQTTGQYGVSVASGTRASYDEQMGAGNLLRPGVTWGGSGGVTNITWAVQQTLNNITTADGVPTAGITLSDAQIAALQAIFTTYSEVANLTFTQVNPGGTSDNAVIRVAAYSSDSDGAGAYAYYPGNTNFLSVAGDVRLNNTSVSTTSLPTGSYSHFAVMHEIGHAMGLAHPGDYNAAPGVQITYANNAQFTQDSNQYTVMSYFNQSATGATGGSFADGLMLHDIVALQQAYGANMTTRTGDTVYGFNSNAGGIYDFRLNATPIFAIWDAGGRDTIDASRYSQNQLIDLNAGRFSNIGGMTGNVAIAFGAVIERAVGGSGADTLIANALGSTLEGASGNDVLISGAGDDFLIGSVGVDTADYSRAAGAVTVNLGVSVAQATGGAGSDTLSAIENVTGSRFNDTLSGRNTDNVLSGGLGDDTLFGMGGNDTLEGGDGADTLRGGLDHDTLIGGAGVDTADYADARSGVTVNLSRSDAQDTGAVGFDTLSQIENLIGSGYADTLTGDAGANRLEGGAGADNLDGMGGADTLIGGRGDDEYYVDSQDDVIVEVRGGGVDTVYTSTSLVLERTLDIERLVAAGTESINLTGNVLNNTLTGNTGANVLNGGVGSDVLIGNGGVDTFVFARAVETSVSAADVILDLGDDDFIDLSRIDANVTVRGLQGFTLAADFTNQAGQLTLTYMSGRDETLLAGDTNGDGVADFAVRLVGDHTDFDHFIFGGGG